MDVVEQLRLMQFRYIPRQQKATAEESVPELAGRRCDAGDTEILTDA
jgi:hypothetical protein